MQYTVRVLTKCAQAATPRASFALPYGFWNWSEAERQRWLRYQQERRIKRWSALVATEARLLRDLAHFDPNAYELVDQLQHLPIEQRIQWLHRALVDARRSSMLYQAETERIVRDLREVGYDRAAADQQLQKAVEEAEEAQRQQQENERRDVLNRWMRDDERKYMESTSRAARDADVPLGEQAPEPLPARFEPEDRGQLGDKLFRLAPPRRREDQAQRSEDASHEQALQHTLERLLSLPPEERLAELRAWHEQQAELSAARHALYADLDRRLRDAYRNWESAAQDSIREREQRMRDEMEQDDQRRREEWRDAVWLAERSAPTPTEMMHDGGSFDIQRAIRARQEAWKARRYKNGRPLPSERSGGAPNPPSASSAPRPAPQAAPPLPTWSIPDRTMAVQVVYQHGPYNTYGRHKPGEKTIAVMSLDEFLRRHTAVDQRGQRYAVRQGIETVTFLTDRDGLKKPMKGYVEAKYDPEFARWSNARQAPASAWSDPSALQRPLVERTPNDGSAASVADLLARRQQFWEYRQQVEQALRRDQTAYARDVGRAEQTHSRRPFVERFPGGLQINYPEQAQRANDDARNRFVERVRHWHNERAFADQAMHQTARALERMLRDTPFTSLSEADRAALQAYHQQRSALHNEYEQLRKAYTDAVRGGAPGWQLSELGDRMDRAWQQLSTMPDVGRFIGNRR